MQQGFPQTSRSQTTTGEDAYSTYRRRSPANGGQTTLSTIHPGGKILEVDTRFVLGSQRIMTPTLS